MAAKNILIVEDDPTIVILISTVLKSRGYSVTTARTGKDALEKVQKSCFNLSLLDIGLPDMKGTELLKKMKKANRDMIIIMLTGHPDHNSSIDSINNDADGYLVKPIRSDDLFAIVENKLKKQEEANLLSDEKVSEWLKSRLSRLALENTDNKT